MDRFTLATAHLAEPVEAKPAKSKPAKSKPAKSVEVKADTTICRLDGCGRRRYRNFCVTSIAVVRTRPTRLQPAGLVLRPDVLGRRTAANRWCREHPPHKRPRRQKADSEGSS